jgi:5S rRNA maturation endonuclease (ribonuclease M5)
MIDMGFDDLKNTVDYVRGIALEEILKQTGSIKHRYDKSKWQTCQGVISVSSNGQKFMNWTAGIGGGGAIDLVIHLNGCSFKMAVFWLLDNIASFNFSFNIGKTLKSEAMGPMEPQPMSPQSQSQSQPQSTVKATLALPERDVNRIPQVYNYLSYVRDIPGKIINLIIGSGKLYADNRGNAVFLLLGKEKKVVGAELRGTTGLRWQGMACGSRKDLGAFYVKGPKPEKMVICESAIDAISYFALHPDCIAISTSGANPNPAWLSLFINKDFDIYCGFDSDRVGDRLADKMIKRYPTVKRLRPEKHDWNEELKAKIK